MPNVLTGALFDALNVLIEVDDRKLYKVELSTAFFQSFRIKHSRWHAPSYRSWEKNQHISSPFSYRGLGGYRGISRLCKSNYLKYYILNCYIIKWLLYSFSSTHAYIQTHAHARTHTHTHTHTHTYIDIDMLVL